MCDNLEERVAKVEADLAEVKAIVMPREQLISMTSAMPSEPTILEVQAEPVLDVEPMPEPEPPPYTGPVCPECGTPINRGKYCKASCRQRAYRARRRANA